MAKPILGYIDCPTCGNTKAMRVTHDKNGEPFAFCETDCSQQLRIGGNAARVARFVKRYPWAAKQVQENEGVAVDDESLAAVTKSGLLIG